MQKNDFIIGAFFGGVLSAGYGVGALVGSWIPDYRLPFAFSVALGIGTAIIAYRRIPAGTALKD